MISADDLWMVFGTKAREGLADARQDQADKSTVYGRLAKQGLIAAVCNVSFEVAEGELFVIMGLSGSGKSTVIRCLSRLIEPTAGKVDIDGDDILNASKKELIELRRHKMGMVFQHFGLFPHMTVADNVAFPLKVQGQEKTERLGRAHEVIELVGLDGREDAYPRELSGGQRQRVGIARSLAVNPAIWFLDEPFSALDPLIRRQLQDEFLRLQATLKKTIVFITHDIGEAVRLADRIAIMRDGEIVQIGTPDEIICHPADDYVAQFSRDIPRGRHLTVATLTGAPVSVDLDGAPRLKASMSLDEALAVCASAYPELPVVDEAGKVIGTVKAERDGQSGRRVLSAVAGAEAVRPGLFDGRSSPALLLLVFLALIAALSPFLPWLTVWPESLTIPATAWIGQGVEALLGLLKPIARAAAVVFGYQMEAANALLTQTPWLAVVIAIIALGAWAGGLKLAILAVVGLGFVLASGYWIESMNTLALVAVSVPLALSLGLAIGLLAFEVRAIRRAVEAVLDVMQTVPTFAYLTPLLVLFGFGPVVGLIASAIYAAPPMARNVLLGLDRVDAEVREAGIMAGTTRFQQLLHVELPAAATQIMVGVNQCIMAALSMAIIAAVIGGFNDISWEILLTMRKAQFGQSLLAGFVIVIFAILIDRISGAFAETTVRKRHGRAIAIAAAIGIALALLLSPWLPSPDTLGVMTPVSQAIDQSLGSFTASYGAVFDSIKNSAMFFVLLPVRIGLDDAVLPFTWGFSWTPVMSYVMAAIAVIAALALAWSGRMVAAIAMVCVFGILHSGLTQVSWLAVISVVAAIGWAAGGRSLALFAAIALAVILLAGLWERAMLSLYLTGVSVIACAIVGGALGTLAAFSPLAWRILRPICDMLQTIPLFVFLIPVLMLFQIGEFTAFIAICLYAVVPMIRYTRHGLVTTPPDLLEAATASGATPMQILADVRAPYALPTILLGLNQTILYAFAMLVIAALVGTTGLGQSIYLALGQADVGLGIASGAAMALLALVTDRLIQGFAEQQRRALDLG